MTEANAPPRTILDETEPLELWTRGELPEGWSWRRVRTPRRQDRELLHATWEAIARVTGERGQALDAIPDVLAGQLAEARVDGSYPLGDLESFRCDPSGVWVVSDALLVQCDDCGSWWPDWEDWEHNAATGASECPECFAKSEAVLTEAHDD